MINDPEMILIYSTQAFLHLRIPGLLGEGNVLGVRIEGHRFASGRKKNAKLLWTNTKSQSQLEFMSPYRAVSFRANQFEGGGGDKSEVGRQVG